MSDFDQQYQAITSGVGMVDFSVRTRLGIKGEEQQRFIIRAQDLRIYPQEDRAESDRPVHVSQPGTVLSGVGLKVRLDLEKFELLSEVQGRYEP